MTTYRRDDGLSPEGERGYLPEPVRSAVLEEVRRLTESRGWDQPFLVVGVSWALPPMAISSEIGTAMLQLEEVLDGPHPLYGLPGRSLPRRFDAAVLISEGWEYPERLHGLSLEELSRHGAPSELPDRVEVRILTLVTRSGQEDVLFLRYRARDRAPEVMRLEVSATGRVHDVFRRYVGLPVRPPRERVQHLFGRLWLKSLLLSAKEDPFITAARQVTDWDPLRAYAEAMTEEESFRDVIPEGLPADALDGFVMTIFDGITWEQAHSAASLGMFPVEMPVAVAEWCDAGLFGRMALDQIETQGELLDDLLARGFPDMASEVCVILRDRGWLEEPVTFEAPETAVLLETEDPCSCGSGRSYGNCHGLPPR